MGYGDIFYIFKQKLNKYAFSRNDNGFGAVDNRSKANENAKDSEKHWIL